jgi:transcriptional antiterminator RfaH
VNWYVVQTKPQSERLVESKLGARSIEAFLPRIENPRRHGPARIEPLFPCYLFVHLDRRPADLSAVRWTPGVRRILSTGDEPVPVDEQVIGTIRSRLGEEGVVRLGPPFGPGDRVRITEGPMAGLCGILVRFASRAKRVRVLLDLLHVPVEIDWYLLEKDSP